MQSANRRRSVFIFGAVALLTASLAAASPAQAQSTAPPDETSPDVVHEETVGDTLRFLESPQTPAESSPSTSGSTTLRAAGYTVSCRVDAQNPHISEGARKKGKIYVIYKSNVKCTGTGSYPAKVTIRVRSGLFWDSAKFAGDTSNGISWSKLRSNDESRTVSVNGSGNIFYTPENGKDGAYFTGHYQGTTTVEITSPTGFKVGTDTSSVVFCKPTTATAKCS